MDSIRTLADWIRHKLGTKSKPESRPETKTRPDIESEVEPETGRELVARLGLGSGPRLAALSDWSEQYHDELEDYLHRLRKCGCSDAVCRERVFLCVPDKKLFPHSTSPENILHMLQASCWNCLFHRRSSKSAWQVEDIYQFPCCERCRFVLDAVNSLADNTSLSNMSRSGILVRKEKHDMLSLARSESLLLSVSIAGFDRAGKARSHVFDIVARNGDVSLSPRLVETGSDLQGPESKYAALSYCWGTGGGIFTTTLDNIESNKQHIPLGQLPKTIQDAIHICRRLGLPYLWVDALCIIQDTGSVDWYEQSGQMRQIYSNAQVTIAADDAPECTVGFWHPDKTRLRRINEGCWIKEPPGRAQDILSTRGWTLQERILSHRILHFSSSCVSWECDECCRFEDGETKIDFLGLSYRAFRLLNQSSPHERLGTCSADDDDCHYVSTHITDFLTSGSWKSIYFAWASIMENYSGRNLTQPKDKLSAISGLASFVVDTKDLGPESYLAGLWAEDLVEGLLWYVSSRRASRPSSIYIAPTWSWASLTGGIKYFRERYQFRFQSHIAVRQARCTASPFDPTGRVTAGLIHLDGVLAEVDLAVDLHSSSTTYTEPGGGPMRVQGQPLTFVCGYKEFEMTGKKKPRWYEVMFDEEPDLSLSFPVRAQDNRDGASINAPRYRRDLQRMYFCLSVGELVDSFTGGKRHWFLVVQKVPVAEETYRRVGIGYFQYCKRSFLLFGNNDVRTISLI
ncbi:hypothetical protein ACJZ2D_013858 [Fusarium nematophilum]